jgi:DNA polymerase-3 subunit delta
LRLRAEQVEGHLSRNLAPVYLVHGDEALLVLEAADAVRAAARRRGHSEREVLAVEKGFDWSAFTQSAASGSLFGERKVVELRLASGKPNAAATAAIEAYCKRPNPDVVLLITMPRPEGPGWWKSAWHAAVDAAGVVVEAQPVSRAQLPQWLARRLAGQRQRASEESLQWMADRVEGNLLAASQEVLKLALLAPEGELSADDIGAAVSSVARYDYETLADALYAGDLARYARALEGLRGEGESADPAADGRRQAPGDAVRRAPRLARRAGAQRESAAAPRRGTPARGGPARRAHRAGEQGSRQRRALG